MNTVRPRSLTVIAILLIVIALASAMTPFLTVARGNFVRNGNGNFQGGTNGGTFQPGQGGGNAQGGGNFQGGGNGNLTGGGNFQGRGGGGLGAFGLFGAARTLGINVQLIGYITTGIAIIGVILTLLAAFGVWKQKRWGLNLALVVALLFVLGALPSLFGGGFGGGRAFVTFNAIAIVRTVLNDLKPLAALPILVMSILPSVRDFTR